MRWAKTNTGIQRSIYQSACSLFVTKLHCHFGYFIGSPIRCEVGKMLNLCTGRPIIEFFVVLIPCVLSHIDTPFRN